MQRGEMTFSRGETNRELTTKHKNPPRARGIVKVAYVGLEPIPVPRIP